MLLDKDLLLKIHDLMVKSRLLEERFITIYKSGQAHFWIGGPGEEAFGVPLGLLAKKGQGIDYDWFHLHYRATPTLIALGMTIKEGLRLMLNKATDPHTGGRNFAGHYCVPQWNVTPISSPIEVQYSVAIGTAHRQKKLQTRSLTIVTGGDAGTAEGDFASCLVWASRPGNELPLLITVQNNQWGISTPYSQQHGEEKISDRAKAFGIRSETINGNDPVEAYISIQKHMEYIRKKRKPVLLECNVSRLYGHSSADGASFRKEEVCPIKLFEEKLVKENLITKDKIQKTYSKYSEEILEAYETIKEDPPPSPETVWNHVYFNNENADWRKF